MSLMKSCKSAIEATSLPGSTLTAAAVNTRRKLIARAAEETKGENGDRNGRIMMSIEGPRDFIEWAEKDLKQDFASMDTEGEGKNEGEIGLYFGLDRTDKPLFMARWKQLKAAWVKGKDYPKP